MKPELESYLWERIGFAGDRSGRFPRDVIEEMIKLKMIESPKQAWATLDKWIKKGKYDYGCKLDLGWKVK